MSEVLGKGIKHVHQDQTTFQATLEGSNLDKDMVQYMSDLDRKIASGYGREVTGTVERVTGRPPKSLRDFTSERKDTWT